ncbi:CatB-related O-acetyltransferase [Algicella marina]|uniref:Antibiotic acetyltransferase n=1 Tax=Algicella marina TaxID=2683284 RepID=A0A6P1SZV0_9RHOB|nr:CatB-related O-acetyltransferase [Algicella marina]QHQ34736.1 antibiotic acetyltransferase [Algicella marina]
MALAKPEMRHPLILPDGTAHKGNVFLRQVIDHPNIEIGDYTYAHDDRQPEDWATTLAPYLFPGAPERLKIGRFCQLAQGVQIVTSSANHDMRGLSTYPFPIFDPERFLSYISSLPEGRDTVIGNDCWLGREAMILPGARLGNGVIVGARAVVSGEVPDYAIVAGNPGKVVRMRLSDADIARMLELAWWDWPIEAIEAAIPALEKGDLAALEALSPN